MKMSNAHTHTRTRTHDSPPLFPPSTTRPTQTRRATMSVRANGGHTLAPVSGPKEVVTGLLDSTLLSQRFADLDQV